MGGLNGHHALTSEDLPICIDGFQLLRTEDCWIEDDFTAVRYR